MLKTLTRLLWATLTFTVSQKNGIFTTLLSVWGQRRWMWGRADTNSSLTNPQRKQQLTRDWHGSQAHGCPGTRHLQGKRSGLGKGLARDTSGNTTDKWLKCFLYLDFHPVALGKELTRDFKEGTMWQEYHQNSIGLSKTIELRYRNTLSSKVT